MRVNLAALVNVLDGGLPEGVTRKEIYTDIGRITAPAFVELLLTQLTSMVDLMMVGSLGAWALTAVGLTSQPKFLLLSVFFALNTGATAMVARFRGAGEQKNANDVMRQALMLTLTLSLAASVLGFIFAEPMIRFMGIDAQEEAAIAGGVSYFRIQMYSFAILALTSCITASLRGVGLTRVAMVYNLVANLVNVVFNWLLIYGNLGFPEMGIDGASWATNIGQLAAFAIAVGVLLTGARRNQFLYFFRGMSFKPDFPLIKRIARIGLPAMFEQLMVRLGMLGFSITVASLGTLQYAAHMVCFNIQSLSFMIGDAFSIASTSLMGQALGRKRPDLAMGVVKRSRKLSILCGCLLGVCFFFIGGPFVSLYNDEPLIIAMGADILKVMAFIMPFQGMLSVLSGALRGAGDTRAVAVISMVGFVAMRPGLSFLFVNVFNLGLMGAWYAMAMDQTTRCLLFYWRFRAGKWKQISV